MKMKINSKDFRVRPNEKVKLKEWPTIMKPFYKSKKRYQKLLREHVEELSSLQRLHSASNRYALLLIFQAKDAAGKDGTIRKVDKARRKELLSIRKRLAGQVQLSRRSIVGEQK
jgi:polyphosphate kinase 2 (PPK2 family)